jgi:hypothetical protein
MEQRIRFVNRLGFVRALGLRGKPRSGPGRYAKGPPAPRTSRNPATEGRSQSVLPAEAVRCRAECCGPVLAHGRVGPVGVVARGAPNTEAMRHEETPRASSVRDGGRWWLNVKSPLAGAGRVEVFVPRSGGWPGGRRGGERVAWNPVDRDTSPRYPRSG